MSRITVITGQYDQIIDAPIHDEAGRPVSFTEDAAGVSFIVYTPDTPKESRLVLPPSRYRDGRIYIDAAELRSLTAGELFMTVELSAGYDGYTDGTFDTGYTVQLQKYLKTDNPPQSTYDRIADLNKDIDELRLDASYASDVHDELRAVDASLADAITALRRGQDGLERAVADVSASIPEIPEIPNRVSQLVNDCSYVTKDRVDGIDLALQDACTILGGLDASVKDVYTKAEVNQMISGLTSLDMEVVDELPAEPDLHTIYLLKEGDLYGQYFYNTKVNDYVRISDTGVDLTAYLTKAEAAQTYAAESGMTERIQHAVSTGVYTAEAVAAEMDASVLAASRTYTDAGLSQLRGDVSILESQVDDFTEAVAAVPGIEQRLGVLEASVGNIQPAGPSFRKITCQSLPAVADADQDALYFLRSSSEASNVFTEYTVVDGAWEIVGWAMSAADGSVDLSGLVNDAQLGLAVSEVNARMDAADASLKNYVDDLVNNVDVSVDLSGYVTEEQLDASLLALDNTISQRTTDSLSHKADKSDTYTKSEVDDRIAAAAIDPSVILDDYMKAEQAEALIQDYDGSTNARIDALDASVKDVYTKDEVDALLADVSAGGSGGSYDDTEVRGLITDVSAYAHGLVIPAAYDDTGLTQAVEDASSAANDAMVKAKDVSSHVDDLSTYVHSMEIPEEYDDTALQEQIDDISVYVHEIVIPEGADVSKGYVDAADASIVDWIDASVTAGLDLILNGEYDPAGYDDTEVRGLIADVSAYAHSIEIPEVENYDDTSVTQAIEDVSTYAHGLTIPAAYDDTELRALIADVSTFSHSLRSGSPFTVVTSLPAPGEADDSLIYMYPDAAGNNNVFTEYVVVNGQWEIIGQGSLDINLAEYAKDASLQAATGQINDVSAGLAATAAELADVSTYVHSLAIPEAYDDTSVTNRLGAHDTSIGGLDASLAELAAKIEDVSAAVDDVSVPEMQAATSQTLGGFKLGFTQNDSLQAYPVLLSASNQAYVIVPWVSGGVSESDVSSMISTALSNGNYLTSSSLTGLASESYVQSYVSTAVNNAGFLTEHQSLKTVNGYSLTGTGNIQITQDLTGYATQSWVNTQLAGFTGGGLTDASVRAIADAYDTSMQTYVNGAVSGVTGGGLSDASIRSIIESYGYMQAASYADIARQSWVEQRIVDLTSGGTVDLTAYASKTYVDTSIQSVKTWVGQQGYCTDASIAVIIEDVSNLALMVQMLDASMEAISAGGGGDTSVDLSGYYTTAAADASYAAIDASLKALDASVKAGTGSADMSNYYTKAAADASFAAVYTKTEVDNKGYLTQHQSLSNYVTKSALDASFATVYTKTEINADFITKNDVSTAGYLKSVVCTASQYQNMNSHDSNTLYIIS